MAYTDQKMSGSKITAIIIVALIHAVLGYAFVTGLAYQYVKKVSEKLNTFDVEEPPPPPPDEPPPPPPDTPLQPPPVVSPPPIVRSPTPPPMIMTVPTPPPTINYIPTSPPPAPPAPPAPRVSQRAGLKGNPGQYFGTDVYPAAAIRAEAQGRVVASLTVGPDGRVTGCTVTSSSGNEDLDSTTCRVAKSRVRFTPARDDSGNPIASTYSLPVRWVLPQ